MEEERYVHSVSRYKTVFHFELCMQRNVNTCKCQQGFEFREGKCYNMPINVEYGDGSGITENDSQGNECRDDEDCSDINNAICDIQTPEPTQTSFQNTIKELGNNI